MSHQKFSTVLRRLREKRNWTQQELARAAGLSRQQISRYEWGGVQPREKNLTKLARALECDADRLREGRESAPLEQWLKELKSSND